jgi:hypothetical protein
VRKVDRGAEPRSRLGDELPGVDSLERVALEPATQERIELFAALRELERAQK